jgi:hypothetical protein
MAKWVLGVLGTLILASTGVAFSAIDQRSKELFFGFTSSIASGCFALITPKPFVQDDDN